MHFSRQVIPSVVMSIMAAISFSAAQAASSDMPMSSSHAVTTAPTVTSTSPVAPNTTATSVPGVSTVSTMPINIGTDSNAYQQDITQNNQDHGQMKRHGNRENSEQLTPEQRAAKQADRQQKMQQRRAHRAALNQACVGHDNQKINAKVNDKIIPGKCKTVFRHQAKPYTTAPSPRAAM